MWWHIEIVVTQVRTAETHQLNVTYPAPGTVTLTDLTFPIVMREMDLALSI